MPGGVRAGLLRASAVTEGLPMLVPPRRNLALQHLQYKTMLLSNDVEANRGEANKLDKGVFPLYPWMGKLVKQRMREVFLPSPT